MKKAKIFSLIMVLIGLIATTAALGISAMAASANDLGEIDVYLIAGQSNAAGCGTGTIAAAATDSRYQNGFETVLYYGTSDTNVVKEFTPVKFGYGTNSSRCGAEIGIAAAVADSGRKSAVIKYGIGGTNLYPDTSGDPARNYGTWTSPSYIEDMGIATDDSGNKTGDLYVNFIKTVADGVKKLRDMGYTPVLRGTWWMQGEAESGSRICSEEYALLLEYLVSDMRNDIGEIFGLSAEYMPVVIGEITRNPADANPPAYVWAINEAQIAVMNKLPAIYRVDTTGLAQVDNWHYSAESQKTIGESFVAVLNSLSGDRYVSVRGDGITVSGAGAKLPGESVTVTLTPDSTVSITKLLYTESGASLDVTGELNGNSYTFTMPDANVILEAATDDSAKVYVEGYGYIPGEFANAEQYPFATFRNGEFRHAYTLWNEVLADAFTVASVDGKTTLYVRRDYNTSESGGSNSYLQYPYLFCGKVNIDLGGNSLIRGSVHLFQLATQMPYEKQVKTEFYITNGTLLAENSSIFAINAHGKAGADDHFYITLDGVKIGISENYASGLTDVLFVTFNGESYNTKVTANLNDCTIDLRTVAPNKKVDIIDLVETGGTPKTADIIINGGNIIADNLTNINFYRCTEGDSVSFGKYNGKYTTLTLNSSATKPADLYEAKEGGYLEFDNGVTSGSDKIYTLTKSDAELTPYGVIPAAYADTQAYPFAIFKDGKFVRCDKNWSLSMSRPKDTLYGASGEGKSMQILLRRDYTLLNSGGTDDNTAALMNLTGGSVLVDLNGYTIDRLERYLFSYQFKDTPNKSDSSKIEAHNLTVTVINGTITCSKGPMINISHNDAYTVSKTVTMNFEDVTIVQPSTATWNQILYCQENGTTIPGKVNLNFTDCTFNIKDAPNQSKLSLWVVNDKNNLKEIDITVKGGEIIGSTWTEKTLVTLGTGDSVKLIPNDRGEYTKLTLPASATAASVWFDTDDGQKKFYKLPTESDTATYIFDNLETEHGTIPAEYADEEQYPFVIFYKGAFLSAERYWLHRPDGTDATVEGVLITTRKNVWDRDIYVVMRRDYTVMTGNDKWLGHVHGKVHIDLGGYTLTTGTAPLFRAMANHKAERHPEYFVSNGSILIYKGAVLDSYSSTTSYTGQTADFTFTNVSFGFASGTNQKSVVLSSSAGVASNTAANATFNNCSFDFITNAPSGASFVNTTASEDNHSFGVTVNGGSFKINDYSAFTMAHLTAGKDTLTMGKDSNNNYPSVILPAGANAPEETFNGGTLAFVKVAENGENSIFALAPVSAKNYTPMMSLTLDSNLIVNVYIPVNGTQKFAFDGKNSESDNNLTANVVEVDGVYYYLVSLPLAADEAARSIILTATVDMGETSAAGTFTFSIPKYASKILDSDATATEKTLVKDVLVYIRSAYAYFGKGATPEIDAIIGNYKPTLEREGSTAVPTNGLSGATFVLDATPTIRFFLPEGANPADYTFKQGGRALETSVGTAVEGGKTYTTVDISVYAYRMCDTITYYVNGTQMGSYHINSYYEFAKNDASLVSLVEAFWCYCNSAAEYKSAYSAN